ncbi:MAG TPA: glycoside hydrolase family 2 TIM barrel-domain containing protein [Streptosporangiaceae bacterium]
MLPAVAGTKAARIYAFNQEWLFGGYYTSGAAARDYDDSGFTPVTLPHTVTPLSWGDWDHTRWEHVWIYRKHFSLAELAGRRAFIHFDGVMVNATVLLNGVKVGAHQGGYLPWSAELTGQLAGHNVLAVVVDSRWLNVPPGGQPRGPATIDFLQPGGIYRDVTLRTVPDVYLADVFARPRSVLNASRRVDLQATLDAATAPAGPVRVTAQLRDGARTIAAGSADVRLTGPGRTVARLSVTGIGDVQLWSPDTPRLYTVSVTAVSASGQAHTATVRTGFREADFRPDGFYLNGDRVKLFGLNRHQLFPYLGMAAPARLQRRDAEILRTELNCNMVRCSHYPQSPHFLDACDELGLMVWQEPPGWGWIGDAAWQDILLRNVSDMIIRDRNRPSVIVWATRVNESLNSQRLYRRTRQLAARLDGSRPTTGAMSKHTMAGWAQDVFGYDDYHASHGDASLLPPLPGVPYLVSEAVGALDGAPVYRWTDPGQVLAQQARMHAQVHDIARSDSRYAGLLGWAGFDYASLRGGDKVWRAIKTPGVADIFRVAKPAAAFYQSQVSPQLRPQILPLFCWDFGPGSPPRGPGRDAMIATNCERLEIYAGGQHVGTGKPDTRAYPHLAYPPVVIDLTVDGAARPELRIDGYAGGRRVATARMSADPARDRLELTADDRSIRGDGSDATRLTFRAVDAYGHRRPHATGLVRLSLAGPGELIGQNPFEFGRYGGVGGAFVRALPRGRAGQPGQSGQSGQVTVTAMHHVLGRASVTVTVAAPEPGTRYL